MLRATAENGKTGTTAKESLLRQAAALDPQLNGIWGELGVAQAQLGMDANAAASLKTAQQRQPEASSTLQLEAMVEAARGNWSQAEKRLLDLGERSRRRLAEGSRRVAAEVGSRPGSEGRCLAMSTPGHDNLPIEERTGKHSAC